MPHPARSNPPRAFAVSLPDHLRVHLEARVAGEILDSRGVGGGCISQTARLQFADGTKRFLKWASQRDAISGLFREEAQSLAALRAAGSIRVPDVIDTHDDDEEFSYILLEWLEPGHATSKSWRDLGTALAALHRNQSTQYGWRSNNFIGSLPQSNDAHGSWVDFWRDQRLLPQLARAETRFDKRDTTRLERLLADLDSLIGIGNDEGPSLLHGDLWSGNVHMLNDGTPAVIDPSAYYGHREVDLAMSKLFGGFDMEFYRAYEASWPCKEDAGERMLVYQLYYLLVHVNLFGGSYTSSTMSAVGKLGF